MSTDKISSTDQQTQRGIEVTTHRLLMTDGYFISELLAGTGQLEEKKSAKTFSAKNKENKIGMLSCHSHIELRLRLRLF